MQTRVCNAAGFWKKRVSFFRVAFLTHLVEVEDLRWRGKEFEVSAIDRHLANLSVHVDTVRYVLKACLRFRKPWRMCTCEIFLTQCLKNFRRAEMIRKPFSLIHICRVRPTASRSLICSDNFVNYSKTIAIRAKWYMTFLFESNLPPYFGSTEIFQSPCIKRIFFMSFSFWHYGFVFVSVRSK